MRSLPRYWPKVPVASGFSLLLGMPARSQSKRNHSGASYSNSNSPRGLVPEGGSQYKSPGATAPSTRVPEAKPEETGLSDAGSDTTFKPTAGLLLSFSNAVQLSALCKAKCSPSQYSVFN